LVFPQLNSITANPTWGDIFEKLFQSSKLKARTSLFTETWQKKRSSFELSTLKQLSKMSSQVGYAVTSDFKSWFLFFGFESFFYFYVLPHSWRAHRLILTSDFRTNLVRGLSNKEMKFQNKGAVPVQIAPL